jgi:hypothetical protein
MLRKTVIIIFSLISIKFYYQKNNADSLIQKLPFAISNEKKLFKIRRLCYFKIA